MPSSEVELLHFISCDRDPDLLRASNLAFVMEGCGQILDNNVGNADTYAQSTPVQSIDMFISHNWVVKRWKKFRALAITFNLPIATMASLSVQFGLVFLYALGFLPRQLATSGWICRVCCVPVFWTVFLFGGELRRYLGLDGPQVFLDKTCIHQTDKKIQKQGVMKLGAFLCKSQQLLVLYTDIYLSKLWTVYEMACYLSLHPVSRIQLVPITETETIFIGLVVLALLCFVTPWLHKWKPPRTAMVFALSAVSPLWASVYRREAKKIDRLHQRFQRFAIQTCTCACEEDRPLVYQNISELMRASGEVPPSATEEEALTAFNILVRTKLPDVLQSAMGSHGAKYRHLACLSVAFFGPYWLDLTRLFTKLSGPVWVCRELVSSATLMLATFPVSTALIYTLICRCQHLQGFPELCYTIASGWICVLVGCLDWYFLRPQRWGIPKLDNEPCWQDLCWLSLAVLNWCAAVWIFRFRGYLPLHKRPKELPRLSALPQRLSELRGCPERLERAVETQDVQEGEVELQDFQLQRGSSRPVDWEG